jgi:hypothetical protein
MNRLVWILASTSSASMVAAADVSGERIFGCLRHHRLLPGKEFLKKTAW